MKNIWASVFLLVSIGAAIAQSAPSVPPELVRGLEAFESGSLEEALEHFVAASALSDSPYLGHSRFWTARTLLALGRIDESLDRFDRFLAQFDPHPYREEASYQRARLWYLSGDHETAVRGFSDFLREWPGSAFESNALYWTAEALLALGRLDASEQMFREVTVRFPASFRYEAAEYRLTLIELRRREDELLTILQWSHQEYLTTLESFQGRERDYQEQLRVYRTRLAGLADEDFQSELIDLNARLRLLQETVDEQRVQINQLLAELRRARLEEVSAPQVSPPASSSASPAVETAPQAIDVELRDTLSEMRQQAMELQNLLLDDAERAE